jgi:hypothetical protein
MFPLSSFSVSIIPSWTDDTNPHKADMLDTAQYNYTSLVSKHATPLPSAAPLHTPSIQQKDVSISNKSTPKKDVKHNRSTSKSFNAFLKDTNDEWSDDIDQKTMMKQEPVDVTIEQHALATEAVLMATTSKVVVVEKPKKSSPKTNKEYLQELLLGKCFLLLQEQV